MKEEMERKIKIRIKDDCGLKDYVREDHLCKARK